MKKFHSNWKKKKKEKKKKKKKNMKKKNEFQQYCQISSAEIANFII